MNSPINTPFFVVLMFAKIFILFFTVTAAYERRDNCTKAIQTLKAVMDKRFGKLERDIEVIARGLNLLNPPASPFTSCKEIHLKNGRSRGNTAYVLQTNTGKIPVYCHMTSHGIGGCGGGGWTLVMKIDGHKQTFHYDSSYWTNMADFNRPGGKTGFDHRETKLPTYWSTPFSKICLGMKIGHQINFIVINRPANSLYSLIADGHYRSTSLDRNTWKSLIGFRASLQTNCNKQGFNVFPGNRGSSKARIGILGNNEKNCGSCDSRIGFGTGGYRDNSNTCGNQAIHNADNGDKHIKAMGYILVQ